MSENEDEVRTFVALCKWGVNIASVVDMEALKEYTKGLPNVVAVDTDLSLWTTAGADFIKKNVKDNNANRVVIAAWTPKTHEPVFQEVLKDINMDPSFMEFVNTREHVSFVHQKDKSKALQVAMDQVRAGIARSALLENVPERVVPVTEAAMVIGGGVAGLQSALDLANQGYKVFLVEQSPTIGGKMASLDRTFPTDDCSIWILGPVMLETQRNKNIELLTYSEVTKISGFVGNFEVEVLQHARYVKNDCNGCGACFLVCPAVASSEFDQGLGPRRAIYSVFSQAVPLRAQIDMDYCIKCGLCENVCELSAIDFEQKDQKVNFKVGGIVMATGFDEFRPDDGYLGYGVHENVMTNLEFERVLAPNGPVVGHIVRPSDGKVPKSMLFINCVGSRDISRNVYCSSGVCCMVTIKNAKLVKAHFPDMDVWVAYIDIRAAGKGYEEYYLASRKEGVKYIKSKVGRVIEDKKTKNLKVVMEDSLSPDNTIKEHEFDMVILSAAMQPSNTFKKLNKVMNLSVSSDGFLKEFHPRLNTVDSDVPGIVLSGAAHGPKSISECIMQSKGASSSLSKLLSNGEYRIQLIRAVNFPEKFSRCGMCADVCPYDAIEISAEKGAVVSEILCRGCGLCANVCPGGAMTIRYYRDEQFVELIDALLEGALYENL